MRDACSVANLLYIMQDVTDEAWVPVCVASFHPDAYAVVLGLWCVGQRVLPRLVVAQLRHKDLYADVLPRQQRRQWSFVDRCEVNRCDLARLLAFGDNLEVATILPLARCGQQLRLLSGSLAASKRLFRLPTSLA